MALALTPEHLELAAAVRGWSTRHCPATVIRAAADSTDAGASATPRTSPPRSRSRDCSGCTCLNRTAGRASACPNSPSPQRNSAGHCCRARSCRPCWPRRCSRPRAARRRCSCRSSLTVPSPARWCCLAGSPGIARRRPGSGALVVTGETGPVLAGALAQVVIAAVEVAGEQAWVVLDSADLEVTELDSVDLTRPLARLAADHVDVPADRVLRGLDRAAVPASRRSSSVPRHAESRTGRCGPLPTTPS